MRRAICGAVVAGILAVPGVAVAFEPVAGVCVPLPDIPGLDWTIRALKIALGGEVDCGL